MKLSKKAKGNKLELEITGAESWYVNTLRRACLADAPTMAIELVEISQNGSILYDEIIAHRLGLIPLTTDLEGYVLPSAEEEQTHEYLAKSSCQLSLEAKGPCVVLAKDLKSKDPKVKPVFPETPIVKLLEGQELSLVCTAVLGTGKKHMKWSPGHAFFRQKGADESPNDGDEKIAEGDFVFTLESWGQLKPEEIVTSGMEGYGRQLKEFEAMVKEL